MRCAACNQERDPGCFYSSNRSRCKDCIKMRMKELRRTDPAYQERDRARSRNPARKAHGIANAKRWRERNPVAYKAQTAVGNAVRDGKLKREPCAMCGAAVNVHAHHRNYNKPLDVTWLCAKCHHRLHAAFPELGGHYVEAAE